MRLVFVLLSLAVLSGTSCAREPRSHGRFILISLDTLRADHLGAYGYHRPTSPFIDFLAARSTLFENAVVQLPGTLPSHMSIFTGLYPGEHAVYPGAALSPRIPTLPEVFRAHRFRTGGHVEGGYVKGSYGFARGFEEWTDADPMQEQQGRLVKSPESVKRTFAAGLDFLKRMQGSDAFFLFLHTYSIHDPYDPPEPYRSRFWKGEPPRGAFPPDGPELAAFNGGGRTLAPEGLEYYTSLYDAQINYTDDVLRQFFAGLEELGIADSVTVVLTSDHGEEFAEHGKLAHEQVYHESLHVPLLIRLPGQSAARRVSTLVQSIDIAPTLYELASIPPGGRPAMSGRSLAPLLQGQAADGVEDAYAEAFVTGDRAFYRQTREGLFQFVRREPRRAEDHVWVSRSTSFDAFGSTLAFAVQSYHKARPLLVSVDGQLVHTEQMDTAERWLRVALPAGGGKRSVELTAPSCDVPASLGESGDPRCLSFLLKGVTPSRAELYDLSRDAASQRDLSGERSALAADLAARLGALRFKRVADPGRAPIDPVQEQRLRALGYVH
jgi:arylsulfatase A-like enzyme